MSFLAMKKKFKQSKTHAHTQIVIIAFVFIFLVVAREIFFGKKVAKVNLNFFWVC
jgi:hypothetical protein